MIHLKPGIDFEKSVVEALRSHGLKCSDEPLEHPDPEIQKMLSEFRLFDPPLTNELYEKWLREQEEERMKRANSKPIARRIVIKKHRSNGGKA